jgi:hypothetical protein
MAARRLAYHVAVQKPEIVPPGIDLCEKILASNDIKITNKLVSVGIDMLMHQIKSIDPFLMEDLLTIMEILNIRPDGTFGEMNIDELKFIVSGFKQGLEKVKQ